MGVPVPFRAWTGYLYGCTYENQAQNEDFEDLFLSGNSSILAPWLLDSETRRTVCPRVKRAPWRQVPRIIVGLLAVAVLGDFQPAHAQSAELRPQPLPSGWVLTPAVSFGGSWDDNVLLVDPGDNPPKDYGSPINPSLGLDYTNRRTRLSIGYDGSIVIYRTLDELNSFEQVARGLLEHRASRRVTVTGQYNLTRAPTTDALQLAGIPFFRVGSRTQSASGGIQVALSKFSSMRAGYSLRGVDFDFDPEIGGGLRGGIEHQASFALDRRLSERLTVGGEYDLRRAIVEAAPESAGPPEDRFNIQSAGMTAQYKLSPESSISGRVGIAQLGSGLTHEGKIAPEWRAGISHRVGRTVVTGSYLRSFIPSFGFGGTFQNEEWAGSAHVPFAANRFYLDTGISRFNNEPLEPGQPNLRSLWWSARVGYFAARWLRVEGFYNRAQQNTGRPGGDLGRNQVGFNLTTSKPFKLD